MSPLRGIRLGVGEPQDKPTPILKKGPAVTFQLRDNKRVKLTVEAINSEGNPAGVDVAWSSDDPSIVEVQPDADGKSAWAVASPGAAGLGTTVVRVAVTDQDDAEIHEGTFDIEVVPSGAVTVNVTAGEPEDKAAETPPGEGGGEVPGDGGDTGGGEGGNEPV